MSRHKDLALRLAVVAAFVLTLAALLTAGCGEGTDREITATRELAQPVRQGLQPGQGLLQVLPRGLLFGAVLEHPLLVLAEFHHRVAAAVLGLAFSRQQHAL